MPGIVRVSVLEAVDLPEVLTDGTIRKDVTAIVRLGPRFYKTKPGIADRGRIDSWNSEFTFPVMNLRDKLMVTICNNEDQSVTHTAIDIPSIIEKGSRDEFVGLEGGGQIHLKMSFVLTDEERKKIETMRLSTMTRREEDRLQRTIVFQTVQPTYEKKLRKSPVSTVTITEVDVSTTDGKTASKVTENVPLGFGSTTKALAPIPVFDYVRAVGSQSSRCFIRTKRSSGVSFNSRIAVKAMRGDVNFQGEIVRDYAKDAGKDRGDLVKSASEYQEVECVIDSQRARNMLATDAAAAAVAISSLKDCNLSERQPGQSSVSGCSSYLPFRERLQSWDGFLKPRVAFMKAECPKSEGQSGQGLRYESRSGPGARWAQKSGLETSWTSPKKARRILREWNGHVTDPLKARTRVFELIKAAGSSHESYDDRRFQEHRSISDSIGAVFHKLVGGAAMILAALFMMWPLAEGSHDSGDGLRGDDR